MLLPKARRHCIAITLHMRTIYLITWAGRVGLSTLVHQQWLAFDITLHHSILRLTLMSFYQWETSLNIVDYSFSVTLLKTWQSADLLVLQLIVVCHHRKCHAWRFRCWFYTSIILKFNRVGFPKLPLFVNISIRSNSIFV